MFDAGYDVRQAPQAWTVYDFKYPADPRPGVWDTHDSARRRRSFLMSEIRNNFAEADYSKLTVNTPEFERVREIRKDMPTKKKSKTAE